ncbi:MAG: flagellar assembly protein FliW [Acidobacteria bacterium]|nr:flagellar assembly protein FliW [Acidobacteriota bacterium]
MPDVQYAGHADGPVSEWGQRLQTRFGDFQIDPRSLVHFPEGLPGFERCRRFALLSSVEMAPLQCLHAVEGPEASFLTIDPRLVLPKYRAVLAEADRQRLGIEGDGPLLWLALIALGENGSASINLRAPVVINPARMIGYQLMPSNGLYPLRHPLVIE